MHASRNMGVWVVGIAVILGLILLIVSQTRKENFATTHHRDECGQVQIQLDHMGSPENYLYRHPELKHQMSGVKYLPQQELLRK